MFLRKKSKQNVEDKVVPAKSIQEKLAEAELQKAIIDADVKKVEKLLSQGVDANAEGLAITEGIEGIGISNMQPVVEAKPKAGNFLIYALQSFMNGRITELYGKKSWHHNQKTGPFNSITNVLTLFPDYDFKDFSLRYLEIADLLIKSGARLDVENVDGRFPLDILKIFRRDMDRNLIYDPIGSSKFLALYEKIEKQEKELGIKRKKD